MSGTGKDSFLEKLHPGMRLDKTFFLAVYGFELSYPGYAEVVITRLNEMGCTRAREYYTGIKEEYEKSYDEMINRVAKWYVKWVEIRQKEVKKSRKLKLLERKRILMEMKKGLISSER